MTEVILPDSRPPNADESAARKRVISRLFKPMTRGHTEARLAALHFALTLACLAALIAIACYPVPKQALPPAPIDIIYAQSRAVACDAGLCAGVWAWSFADLVLHPASDGGAWCKRLADGGCWDVYGDSTHACFHAPPPRHIYLASLDWSRPASRQVLFHELMHLAMDVDVEPTDAGVCLVDDHPYFDSVRIEQKFTAAGGGA